MINILVFSHSIMESEFLGISQSSEFESIILVEHFPFLKIHVDHLFIGIFSQKSILPTRRKVVYSNFISGKMINLNYFTAL